MATGHFCHDDETMHLAVTGLTAIGYHGVLDHERRYGQPFLVDLDLAVDSPSGDDIADTLNYAVVATEVVALIEGDPVNLIETLASRIADCCLRHDKVRSVSVTVHKPQAPVAVAFGDITASLIRRKP